MSQRDGPGKDNGDESDGIELGDSSESPKFEIEHTRVASREELGAPPDATRVASAADEPGATRVLPTAEAPPAPEATSLSLSELSSLSPSSFELPTQLQSPAPEEQQTALRQPEPAQPTLAQDDGGTRVDMGDDLLEKTAVLPIPAAGTFGGAPAAPATPEPGPAPAHSMELIPAGPISRDQVEDLLQSARILAGENLIEDAKRILRKILLTDPGRVTARKMLEEIHETELKQIFGDDDSLPRRRTALRAQDAAIEVSADSVLKSLERDLRLGLVEDRPSLFRDKGAIESFGAQMDRDFAAAPAAERVDLGIAFLEMGLPELAARHFRAAAQSLSLEPELGTAPLLMATGLLAYALIEDGRAFEATLAMQPLLNDVEIPREGKLDLLYLMGRAFEVLGKSAEARSWYAQVAELEPHYRDLDERLHGMGKR